MTFMISSSSLATIGRSSPFLRLPASSRCSIYLALQNQSQYRHAFAQQRNYASNKLKSAARVTITQPPSQNLVSPEVKPANDNPYDFRDKINPPSTTLPAALNVPERQPDQGTIKYYVSVGRSYWAFYKTGVKNVWRNGQERRRLVRRARASTHKTPPPAMPDTKQNTVLDERGLGQYENYPFTRAEFQFFTRAWRDAKRIPIFIILLAVFGEYLPLVVMFCTPLVPYTCRIPKQIQKAREKIEEKRSQSFRGQLGSVPTQHKNGTNEDVQKLEQLDAAQIDHLGRSLGLYFGFWDRLGAVWPPRMMLRKKVNKKLQYLELDDALFRRDGGVKLLNSEEEIKIAAEDRGIDILNRSTEEIQRLLEAWESGAKDGKTLSMLLSRPSVWAPNQNS